MVQQQQQRVYNSKGPSIQQEFKIQYQLDEPLLCLPTKQEYTSQCDKPPRQEQQQNFNFNDYHYQHPKDRVTTNKTKKTPVVQLPIIQRTAQSSQENIPPIIVKKVDAPSIQSPIEKSTPTISLNHSVPPPHRTGTTGGNTKTNFNTTNGLWSSNLMDGD
ncbi:hypothetical protein ACTA71_000330 [Dictyostelium dimigraforme]